MGALHGVFLMRNKITSLAAAALIAATALAAPTSADARGGRNAAAIIGGLAFGALLGGALSAQGAYHRPRSYDAPGYYVDPRYSGPAYDDPPQSAYDPYYRYPSRRYYGYD
jgi:hypothetical protein